jgi:hypothetical protein
VDLEILPEPSDEERQAILQAFRADVADDLPPTPWRFAALHAVDLHDELRPAWRPRPEL